MKYSKLVHCLILTVVGAGLLLCGSGCAKRPLKVGVVNTERIIRENPKYMELNEIGRAHV